MTIRCDNCDKRIRILASEYDGGDGFYDEQASFWERRAIYNCHTCAEAAYEAHIASNDAAREWPMAENE